ncbi:hypothetical protein ABU162_21390 [Paenibacillus thiaminolyticus]|uniref:hypothetical protein n=1 Tax=Paenibacillus thiaminolyticus TaxID=49283 RepID=UPI0035A5EF7C
MMTLRKLIVIIVLVVLSLSGIRLAFIALLPDASGLSPVQGLIDLRGQDLDSMRIIPLNGEWGFIPGVLLEDDLHGAASSGGEPSYDHVPGSWRPVTGSASGYGSYRLRILMSPGQERSFTVRIQGIVLPCFEAEAFSQQTDPNWLLGQFTTARCRRSPRPLTT